MKLSIFLLLLFLIIVRFLTARSDFKDGDLIRITTTVYSEVVVYDDNQYLNFRGLKIYLPKYPEIHYGDTVIVEGFVENDFLKKPKLIEIKKGNNILVKLRSRLIGFYKASLPEPHSSLIAGMVLGSKNMPEVFWETLRNTGTAHVVVASGTNVTLTASFLLGISTYFFRRRTAIILALIGISGYVFLSGLDAPIVRAAIMGGLTFIAQLKGKVATGFRTLIITSYIMLFIRPLWITDLGFILSFVATLSLMIFQNKVNEKLKFLPGFLREGLSTSIAAQIGVAPIIYASFGQFNILSPIINALILWTTPFIMVLGMISGIVGLIVPKIGEIILYLSFPFTLWFIKILEIF